MDTHAFRLGRVSMPVAVAVIAATVVLGAGALTAAEMLRGTPRPAATHEASSGGSSIRAVAAAPRLVSGSEARFLVRRGATSAKLAAENQQRWERLQLRMLDDPWIIGLLQHRPGMTMSDLARVYLARR